MRCGALYRIAVLACRRRRVGGAFEQSILAAAARRQTIAQRMQADAQDRAAREIVYGNAFAGGDSSSIHLEGPHDGLVFVVAHNFGASFVQRSEEDLQVIRVGIDTHDNARHDIGLVEVIHRKGVMSPRAARKYADGRGDGGGSARDVGVSCHSGVLASMVPLKYRTGYVAPSAAPCLAHGGAPRSAPMDGRRYRAQCTRTSGRATSAWYDP